MKKRIKNRIVLGRYERSAGGSYYLDVSANNVEDLYNSYDKSAPFARRDLDQDLVAYLLECCRELKSVEFEIRLNLIDSPNQESLARVQSSAGAYFEYLIETERVEMRRRYKRSIILVFIGVGILFGSTAIRRLLVTAPSVLFSVLSEGLAISAWIAIWEALALFVLELLPSLRRVSTYTKLSMARVSVREP